MNLTDRGQAYTTSNKVATVNTDLQLTYRGRSYQPSSVVWNDDSKINLAGRANLVYRGVPYIHSQRVTRGIDSSLIDFGCG